MVVRRREAIEVSEFSILVRAIFAVPFGHHVLLYRLESVSLSPTVETFMIT